MKKILTLLAALAATAIAHGNTIVVTIGAYPNTPQTCVTVSAEFGITVTSITTVGSKVSLVCAPDWTPTADQLAALKTFLEDGQPAS